MHHESFSQVLLIRVPADSVFLSPRVLSLLEFFYSIPWLIFWLLLEPFLHLIAVLSFSFIVILCHRVIVGGICLCSRIVTVVRLAPLVL